ncbi:MAG: glycosyltransferase [Candidatus Competibacteraceae bacterium]|nr:glycosyltransferase [Candidatus Competibacteraceae bacterium]
MISIIMPVYNVEPRWLEAAIESVRRQLYSNWELCIADDGSTRPETLAVLRRLDDPRVKIRFLERNPGISPARPTPRWRWRPAIIWRFWITTMN